jgi:aspartate/methionine/tyrosine aminotransferase
MLGAKVVQIPLDAQSGFRIDVERLVSAVSPKTRAIIVNTPNNPTGAIAVREELDALLKLARSEGLWLIVDEIYHDITYDPRSNDGILSMAEPDDPLIYVGGFSKSYAMTGWRIGYAVAANEALDVMLRAHQMLVTSSTSFVQWGALQALSESAEVEAMRRTYAKRRTIVLETLDRSGLAYVIPDGAFYVFPHIPEGFEDANTFCETMLMKHGVALVPGGVFGDAHNHHFRLCFACATEQLHNGLSALLEGVLYPSA